MIYFLSKIFKRGVRSRVVRMRHQHLLHALPQIQGCRTGGGVGARVSPQPDFARSVIAISTRGAEYAPHLYLLASPQIFRLSAFPPLIILAPPLSPTILYCCISQCWAFAALPY